MLSTYFKEKWRAETPQYGLEFDNFRTPVWKQYLQMHLVAEQFFYGSDDRGFLKEGVKTYLMAPMSPLVSHKFFFCLHIYSLWSLVCTNFRPSFVAISLPFSSFTCHRCVLILSWMANPRLMNVRDVEWKRHVDEVESLTRRERFLELWSSVFLGTDDITEE